MIAEKTAKPSDNLELQAQLDMLSLPHINDFIMRRITHGAAQLSYADIEKFVRYENLVLSSYITSVPPEEEGDGDNKIEKLSSKDGVYFNLIDTAYEIKIEQTEAPTGLPLDADKLEVLEPTTQISTGIEPIVMCDNDAELLINTVIDTKIASGVNITAACYVGKNRENNEDGIVINPDSNQVVVIDAMGGYGNGVSARDIFVECVLATPGDIEASVSSTQKNYDNIGLEQGGVCIIDVIIDKIRGDAFRINMSQAGDVHALLFDENGDLKYETVDEAIGHQVVNAVIGEEATHFQRINGWENFGRLTQATLRARAGWRMLIYSDGIANSFDATTMGEFIDNRTGNQAIASISRAVDEAMSQEGSYKDNASITIIDL